VKSLDRLLELLLQDEGDECGVDVSRDVGTLRARVEHEGLSFATITLAAYGQCLDQALANGSPVPGGWAGFGQLRSGLPKFLQGFLHRVFDKWTGHLLDDPDVNCIRALRQICRFCSKVEIPCSDARDRQALRSFEETDQTLRETPCPLPRCDSVEDAGDYGADNFVVGLWQTYQRVAATLVAAMPLQDEDSNVPILCRHGPGATVEKLTPNGKWAIDEWHEELEAAGFTYRLAMLGAEKALWGVENVPIVPRYVSRQDERPVKVTLVPKTLKGPRVIAVEPAVRQFAQQGLAAALRDGIDQCRYTSGRINFRDQEVNQRLALLSSVSGFYSTIDLKDASDRVTCDHVRVLFEAAPEKFRAWLWATRGTRALLPDGREIDLQKYASMGSAMCFPVEALTFFVMVVAIRAHALGGHVSPDTVERLSRGVYVYGDDILCPADETPTVLVGLEAFGLKVNTRKTFWTGRFRESCGTDAFAGVDVTPTYLRRPCPEDRSDAQGIVSWVATANALYQRGKRRVAHALQERVERLLGPLPAVPEDSPALGWQHFSECKPATRLNRRLQRRETLCWVPKPRRQPDPLTSELGLLAKCLRRVRGNPLPEKRLGRIHLRSDLLQMVEEDPIETPTDHLSESERPHALTLKRAWVAL
jgi:hypothetical protein